MADPYKIFGSGWGELFEATWWHCGEQIPTHYAPDGSLYTQKGLPNGSLWWRGNDRWWRVGTGGGVVDVGQFGGIADVRYGTAATTATNAVIQLAGLTAADIGKRIVLRAAAGGSRALSTVHVSIATSATTIAADAAIGAATIQVASSAGFVANDPIKIGSGTLRFESAVVLSIPDGTHITLKAGLKLAHTAAQADPVANALADHFTCAQTLTNADMGHYIEIPGAGPAGALIRGEVGDVGGQIGSALAVGDNRIVLPGYGVASTGVVAGTATIGGDQLITTIVDVSGGNVTVALAPSTTLAQSDAMWCTPNNAAVAAALLAGTTVVFPEQAVGSIYGFDPFVLTDEDDTLLISPGVAFAVTGPFALDANATRVHAYSSGAIIRGFDPQHATFRYWGPNGPYIGTQPRCVQIGVTPGKAVTANELWSVSIHNEVRAVHSTGLGVGHEGVGVDTFATEHVRATDFHYGVGTGIDVTGATQTCWFRDTCVYATTGDDGQGGGFGRGVGIRIAGDPADPQGGVTAQWWSGGIVQNFLVAFRLGNGGTSGNVTTTTLEDFVLESFPQRDAITFDLQQASNCIIRGHHFEGTAFEDGSLEDPAHISIGFKLGLGPRDGTNTRVTVVAAGGTSVPVLSSAGFLPGDQILISAGTARKEAAQILSVPDGTHLIITEPLKNAHSQVSTTVNGTATAGTNIIPVVSTAGLSLLDVIEIGHGTPRAEFATIFALTPTSIQIYNPPLTFTHTAVQADVVQQSDTVAFPSTPAANIYIKDNKELGGVAVMFRLDYAREIYVTNNSIIMENADPVHAPGVIFNNRQLGRASERIYFYENSIDQAVTGVVFDDLTGVILNENHVFDPVSQTYDPNFWYYGTGHWLRLMGPTTWVSGTLHRITGDWTLPGGLVEIGRTGEGDGDGANAWDLSRLIGTNAAFTWTTPDGGFTPNFVIDQGSFTILPKYAATVGSQNRGTGIAMAANVWDIPGVASVSLTMRLEAVALSHNPLSTVLQYQYRGHRIFDADDAGQFFLGAKDGDGPALLFGAGSPEGARAAPPSSVYHRQDDGSYWLKVTGTGTTLWQLIAAGGPFVPTARTLTGTAPITIDGVNTAVDLSANRTIAINNVSNIGPGAAAAITASATIFSSPLGVVGSWNTLATLGIVPFGRTLTTTFPVRIDGGASADLSTNRTLSIAPSGVNGDVLTTLAGVVVWQAPAGGFVPTSRTVQGTAPIQIDGVNTAVDLSVNRVWSVLGATTGAVGVIQLADDLDGTATAPDVIAATGAGGTFTVRCTALNFTTSGTITNSSGNLAISAAVNDLALSAAGALTATAGAGSISIAAGGVEIDTSGIGFITLQSANGVNVACTSGNVLHVAINSTTSFEVHEGKISLNNHTLNGGPAAGDPTDAVKININGSDYWIDVFLI